MLGVTRMGDLGVFLLPVRFPPAGSVRIQTIFHVCEVEICRPLIAEGRGLTGRAISR